MFESANQSDLDDSMQAKQARNNTAPTLKLGDGVVELIVTCGRASGLLGNVRRHQVPGQVRSVRVPGHGLRHVPLYHCHGHG